MKHQRESEPLGKHVLIGANGLRLDMKAGVISFPASPSTATDTGGRCDAC